MWVTMPYDPSKPASYNRSWLKSVLGAGTRPNWNRTMKRWEIARSHLWVLTSALADRFGEVEVLVEFNTTEQCSKTCRKATNPVYECVCNCKGKFHGGRGAERNWIPVGAHRLLSKDDDPKLVHFVVHRGDMPASQAPAEEIAPASPGPQSTPKPKAPTVDDMAAREADRPAVTPCPAPPTPSPSAPAQGELPPGCGLAAFGFVLALFSLLALGISPWFWIGSIVVLLVGLAGLAEQHGL